MLLLRPLLGGFFLVIMMRNDAAADGTGYGVVSGIVPGNATDDGAANAAFGLDFGRHRANQRRCAGQ